MAETGELRPSTYKGDAGGSFSDADSGFDDPGVIPVTRTVVHGDPSGRKISTVVSSNNSEGFARPPLPDGSPRMKFSSVSSLNSSGRGQSVSSVSNEVLTPSDSSTEFINEVSTSNDALDSSMDSFDINDFDISTFTKEIKKENEDERKYRLLSAPRGKRNFRPAIREVNVTNKVNFKEETVKKVPKKRFRSKSADGRRFKGSQSMFSPMYTKVLSPETMRNRKLWADVVKRDCILEEEYYKVPYEACNREIIMGRLSTPETLLYNFRRLKKERAGEDEPGEPYGSFKRQTTNYGSTIPFEDFFRTNATTTPTTFTPSTTGINKVDTGMHINANTISDANIIDNIIKSARGITVNNNNNKNNNNNNNGFVFLKPQLFSLNDLMPRAEVITLPNAVPDNRATDDLKQLIHDLNSADPSVIENKSQQKLWDDLTSYVTAGKTSDASSESTNNVSSGDELQITSDNDSSSTNKPSAESSVIENKSQQKIWDDLTSYVTAGKTSDASSESTNNVSSGDELQITSDNDSSSTDKPSADESRKKKIKKRVSFSTENEELIFDSNFSDTDSSSVFEDVDGCEIMAPTQIICHDGVCSATNDYLSHDHFIKGSTGSHDSAFEKGSNVKGCVLPVKIYEGSSLSVPLFRYTEPLGVIHDNTNDTQKSARNEFFEKPFASDDITKIIDSNNNNNNNNNKNNNDKNNNFKNTDEENISINSEPKPTKRSIFLTDLEKAKCSEFFEGFPIKPFIENDSKKTNENENFKDNNFVINPKLKNEERTNGYENIKKEDISPNNWEKTKKCDTVKEDNFSSKPLNVAERTNAYKNIKKEDISPNNWEKTKKCDTIKGDNFSSKPLNVAERTNGYENIKKEDTSPNNWEKIKKCDTVKGDNFSSKPPNVAERTNAYENIKKEDISPNNWEKTKKCDTVKGDNFSNKSPNVAERTNAYENLRDGIKTKPTFGNNWKKTKELDNFKGNFLIKPKIETITSKTIRYENLRDEDFPSKLQLDNISKNSKELENFRGDKVNIFMTKGPSFVDHRIHLLTRQTCDKPNVTVSKMRVPISSIQDQLEWIIRIHQQHQEDLFSSMQAALTSTGYFSPTPSCGSDTSSGCFSERNSPLRASKILPTSL